MELDFNIPTQLQQLISAEQAHHYNIIPFEQHNGTLVFKTDNQQQDLASELQIIFGKEIQLIDETKETIQKYLTLNYRQQTNNQRSSELHFSEDFLLNIIHEAKSLGSSDIHFEVFEEQSRIRFRIDGKLLERYLIPQSEYPTYVNRIKILSELDISEKRLPQDGRINIKNEQEEFDIRVSVLPTLHGEKIVLRLLSKDTTAIELDTLGFTIQELKRYKESIKNPNGIILISGPTGSGKTTTLYATLKLLNTADTNILTIEDPIEYTLEGINQVQLKENIGLDFASTLRTFLRQDPDIIMVGEIRDAATANMAIRAALTGHLVLSTIHTNSAWATISRLVDMGVPPFLIASTLNVSVAQRLVRKLCNQCKKKEQVRLELFPEGFSVKDTLKYHYAAQGCQECYHTGYSGRKAIYEIIPITKELTRQIKDNVLEIDDYLHQNNIETIKVNALKLIQSGETSIEEVYSLLTN
ncbi:MAG: general secretion pathway protein GspE [Flavobacteriaceae bacterium]|nr:MAG: general secretion pathway protein GspE [Flavobacteriaceae bacterium]